MVCLHNICSQLDTYVGVLYKPLLQLPFIIKELAGLLRQLLAPPEKTLTVDEKRGQKKVTEEEETGKKKQE
jgi:hypothetical protein